MSYLIGVTGMPFSGKSTLSHIAEDRGYERFRMGSAIIAQMEEQGIDINNRNVREFSTQIREDRGHGVAAELSVPHIRELLDEETDVVIDGVRSPEEIDIFREHFGNDIIFIAVQASQGVRFERAMERDREDDDFESFGDFEWNDNKQLGWGLGETIKKADVLVSNEEDLGIFRETCEAVLTDIEKGIV